jgi:hypothetical protein
MHPGECVITKGISFEDNITFYGVTPHAQNIGVSLGFIETASP